MSIRNTIAEEPFAPNKTHNLVYYVVKSLNREVGSIELMKIIFLIDVAFWRLFGRTITGIQYIREQKGPFAKAITQAARDMARHELAFRLCLSRGWSEILKHAWSPGSKPRFEPELVPEEVEVVRRTLKSIKHLSPLDLENQAYTSEPMKSIKEEEDRSGQSLIGRPLDFGLLKRDPFMQRWLENREKAEPLDEEYLRIRDKERREFEELLATM